MYPTLKLKLTNARVEWDQSTSKIALRGGLCGKEHVVEIPYFVVTTRTVDGVAKIRHWVVWMPIHTAIVDIVHFENGDQLPSNIVDRSMCFTVLLSANQSRAIREPLTSQL